MPSMQSAVHFLAAMLPGLQVNAAVSRNLSIHSWISLSQDLVFVKNFVNFCEEFVQHHGKAAQKESSASTNLFKTPLNAGLVEDIT